MDEIVEDWTEDENAKVKLENKTTHRNKSN